LLQEFRYNCENQIIIHGVFLSHHILKVDAKARVKLTNISCRRLVHVDRNLPREDIWRYAHLAPEVLANPPAAYTPNAEMYSAGILIWEMWTQKQAFLEEIFAVDQPLDTLDKFVAHIERKRPSLEMFHYPDSSPTSPQAEKWLGYMQPCWAESERLSCKALLQLIEGSGSGDALQLKEEHYGSN